MAQEMKTCFALITSVIAITSGSALAGVTPNGNFYISYLDITAGHPGVDRELAISRTYNSFNTQHTWFGKGWSTDLENRIRVLPGGDVVLYQDGVGNAYRYEMQSSEQQNEERTAREAVILSKHMGLHGHLTPIQSKELEESLKNDPLRRQKLAEQENLSGTPVAGQVFKGTLCSNDIMRALWNPRLNTDGSTTEELILERNLCRGGLERYDTKGRLIRREAGGSDYHFDLDYANDSANAQVMQIKDSKESVMKLHWNNQGLLKEVELRNARGDAEQAFFEYKDGLLSLVRNALGTVYQYRYDADANLNEIRYEDNSTLLVTYDPRQRVTQVTERDGSSLKYSYAEESPSQTKGLPNFTTESSQELREIDPTLGKLTRLKNEKGDFRYRYNEKGQLISASRDNLLTASIEYDEHENLIRLAIDFPGNEPEKVLRFKYDDKNRVRKLIIPGKGYMNVRYDRDGEMELVPKTLKESDALDVVGLTGTLYQLVKPAGIKVPLSPSR